eukprot:TRINITY_DN90447_c0_g1_i1.p1 TRINITY_DN90447_c0_g1~~TRINITY_DN90447_c0_g1_i1.p1  ORF type:complete len:268 (-),score=39.10 TRINITY_DN90447_c0_g1_i1:13-762(-)
MARLVLNCRVVSLQARMAAILATATLPSMIFATATPLSSDPVRTSSSCDTQEACEAKPGMMSLLQLGPGVLEGGDASTELRLLQGHAAANDSVPAPGPAPPAVSSLPNKTMFSVMNRRSVKAGASKGNSTGKTIAPAPAPVVQRAPYTHSIMDIEDNASIMKPIENAEPVPALTTANLTGDFRDCILSDWSAWSDCVFDMTGIAKGGAQKRFRKVIQPWLIGGKFCGVREEVEACKGISVAAAIFHIQQ